MSELTKECPCCAEDIKINAKVCKHCGHELVASEASIAASKFNDIVSDYIAEKYALISNSGTVAILRKTKFFPIWTAICPPAFFWCIIWYIFWPPKHQAILTLTVDGNVIEDGYTLEVRTKKIRSYARTVGYITVLIIVVVVGMISH